LNSITTISKLIISILIAIYSASAKSSLYDSLKYGKYNVGVKYYHEYDKSRSYFPKYHYFGTDTELPMGRPMQIVTWYPALLKQSAEQMTYGNYLAYTSSETDFNLQGEKARQKHLNNILDSLPINSHTLYKALWQQKTKAYLDIEPLQANFPVIIYAPPMNASSHDNAVLCEYLASHGYLVISVAAKGEFSRNQSQSIVDAYVQALDLGFLWEFSRHLTQSKKVATIGYSLGGLSNILFATQNQDLDAIVTIDSSIMSQGWLDKIRNSALYRPESLKADLLMFSKNMKQAHLNPDDFFQEAKYTNKGLIRFNHNTHYYFSSEQLTLRMHFGYLETDMEQNAALYAYTDMSNYILAFIKNAFSNEHKLEKLVQPKSEHSFVWKNAQKKPPAPESITNLINRYGFSYAKRIISDVVKYDPSYPQKLSWRDLNTTADALLKNKQINDAIGTLNLSLLAFPNWYKTHKALANAYLIQGHVETAIFHYQQALVDNPTDAESIKALQKTAQPYIDYKKTKIDLTTINQYIGEYRVDDERFRRIYLENNTLYLYSNYWDKPIAMWPYKKDLFLVTNENGQSNMQILFQFNEDGSVVSLKTRGLNSGRIGSANPKIK
jgi:hypothetical protein